MLTKKLKISIIFSALCFFAGANLFMPVIANESSYWNGDILNSVNINKNVKTKENIIVSQDAFAPLDTTNTPTLIQSENKDEENNFYFVNATDKFAQCNINASWNDFKDSIISTPKNDFIYISFANKMADLGLFDLANLAISKIQDKDLANVSIDAMERFYYPRIKLKPDDEMYLAEAYSNIMYNNQSSESTNELLKNDNLLSNYDYANYLVALGSYKSNFFPQAKKYINIALIQNPTNINYQVLKAKIFAEDDDPNEAIKIVESLKKQDLYSYEYERKIKSLEQFVLYKAAKQEWLKNYHLGYYYYLENDNAKAIRTLQTALSSKKKSHQSKVYALMSQIYLSMNEFEKAADTAQKSHRINHRNALITLGDLNYRDKKYKQALECYKLAAKHDKKSYIPLVKEAQTYQKLANVKKAKELYKKVLKTHFDSCEAYYNVALLEQDREVIYLKKALAINPLFEDAWIQLAKIQIDLGNYDIAKTYLVNAFYIDENDFRYYYYQGLINKNSGNYNQAHSNFEKCLKLNSSFKEAQNELNNITNSETQQQGNL